VPLRESLNLLLSFLMISMFAQIEKIEPPFWYAGMHNPELQILFYSKKIAQYQVSVSNAIAITEVLRRENPNYLFVTINTKNISACDFLFTFKKSKSAFAKIYTLKERRENSAQRRSFDSSDVMYLLMPDRFANGNPNNQNDTTATEKYNRNLPEGHILVTLRALYYIPFYRYVDFDALIGLLEMYNTVTDKSTNILDHLGYNPLIKKPGNMKNDIRALKPIRNKYYEEIKKICKQNNYNLISVMKPICNNVKGLDYFEKANYIYP
jgi:hypothetical protein